MSLITGNDVIFNLFLSYLPTLVDSPGVPLIKQEINLVWPKHNIIYTLINQILQYSLVGCTVDGHGLGYHPVYKYYFSMENTACKVTRPLRLKGAATRD